MDLSFVFFIAGAIILIGFFGSVSFERTKVPDILVLLGIGILLGPVVGLIDPGNLTHFAEYFGSFALMIILFEGGMDMDIDKLIKEFGSATLLVLISFVLSVAAIAGFLVFIMQWEPLRAALLGTIMGCTSAAIVIPVVCKMNVKEEIKTMISIESALSDVLAIVATVSLIEFIKLQHIGMQAPFHAVASSFSIALLGGVMSAFVWLKVLDIFRDRKYSYMTTLAVMLILYGTMNFLGGSGPIALLVFGIILGNSHDFVGFLKLRSCALMDDTIKFLHGEITFFVRTFFFVYMGMMISSDILRIHFLNISGAVVLLILLMRYLSVSMVGAVYHEKRNDRLVMLSMLPRGLASAVLATLPVSANIRDSEDFINYTFIVIVLTNIIMTAGVFATERMASVPAGGAES
jgi:cell volume regulation protein A